MNKGLKVAFLVLLVLLIDQAVKFYIKLHFHYNEEVFMFGQEWARLHFVENEGMAFGITFDWEYGKLLLSSFRILMVAGLIYYIRLLLRAEAPMGFVYSVGLITAGAVGNILDSAFYGLIFSDSTYHYAEDGIAQLVNFGQGYGQGSPLNGFLHGKVVDMLYFPMKLIHVPEWMPMIGGEEFLFFSPIFNIADAAITTGVLCILLFQRQFFRDAMLHDGTPENEAEAVAEHEEVVHNDLPSDEISESPNDLAAPDTDSGQPAENTDPEPEESEVKKVIS